MHKQLYAEIWLLDEARAIPLSDFCSASGLLESLVTEMVIEGVLLPHGDAAHAWLFSGACLARAQRALQLQREFELNWAAVALLMPLLDELRELRRQQQLWLRSP